MTKYFTWKYIPWNINIFFISLHQIKIYKMKRNKIIYYVTTGLLTALMLFSAGMYLFNNDAVQNMFISFGYPTYIIYPLAFAKLVGLFAIWNPNFKIIKEWAYAGFFFDFILAFFAHYMIADSGQTGSMIAMLLLIISYRYKK